MTSLVLMGVQGAADDAVFRRCLTVTFIKHGSCHSFAKSYLPDPRVEKPGIV